MALTGGNIDGRVVLLQNVGGKAIILTSQDAGSLAANQFALPDSAAVELPGFASVALIYNAAIPGWITFGLATDTFTALNVAGATSMNGALTQRGGNASINVTGVGTTTIGNAGEPVVVNGSTINITDADGSFLSMDGAGGVNLEAGTTDGLVEIGPTALLSQTAIGIGAPVTVAVTGGPTENNFNPAGFSTTTVLRIDITDSLAMRITGFVAPTGNTAQLYILENVGTATITYSNDAAGSLPGNRILCPNGVDYVSDIDGSVLMLYDPTSTAWRILGSIA